METNISVATVRALYESLASEPANFVSELNEVTNRFSTSDLFHGFTDVVLFPSSVATRLVLPRQFVAILGYDWNNVPLPAWGTFHQFIEQGIGWMNPDQMGVFGLISEPDVCHQVPISGTVTLRVKPSIAVDAGKSIRFFGTDQNGAPISTAPTGVDGINLVTAVPSSDTTQQFTHLSMIQCQTPMLGNWTLWQVENGVETQIGSYYPNDTIPTFRSYKIGQRKAADVIRCFCRRQWIPVSAETDPVFPGHLPAIKLGFKALQLENSSKYGSERDPNADGMWDRALDELDKVLAQRRGGELPSLRMIGGPYPQWNYTVN